MTVLNFPSTAGQPTDGSFTYTANGVVYRWDGEKWVSNTQSNNGESFDDRYVNADGDTMTGALNVPAGATGTEVPQIQEVVQKTGDTMTGDLTVPSLNGGPLAGFRNQIINGDFRVWQRGAAAFESTTNQFLYGSADRWGLRNTPAGNPSLERGANGPDGFAYNASLAANSVTRQRVELTNQHPAPFVNGSTWTISVWTNNDVIPDVRLMAQNGTDLIDVGPAVPTGETSNGFKRYSKTQVIGDMGSANDFVEVWIRNNSGNPVIKFTGVQLEPGPVATPFEHRPIGLELALCQRFYCINYDFSYSLNGSNQAQLNLMLPWGASPNPTSAVAEQLLFQFPVTMRSQPTVSTIAPDGTAGEFYTNNNNNVALRGADATTTRARIFLSAGGTFCAGVVKADAEL